MELYEHQKRELEETKDLTHVAYYWDMGLGKTYAGAEKLMSFCEHGENRKDLIICQKSKIEDWLNHFAEHYRYEISAYDLTKPKAWRGFWDNPNSYANQVGIINYDLAWRREELLQLENFTLLLDESSLIQNETSKRAKFILKLKPKNVILLSGTPTGGKYERLWSQLHLLGWEISKKMYWAQYVDVEYATTYSRNKPIAQIPIVKGYKNVERLKRKMKQHGCRFLKTSEVFDLPEQTFIKEFVPVTPEYRHFKKHRIVEVGGRELVGDTTLTKMLYERMLCGCYNEAKVNAFEDLLTSTEDRIVVFYNFKQELETLKGSAIQHKRGYSLVNGECKDLLHYENDSNAVTFVQYQAGAMGLNLQLANKVVYYSLPLSSELYEQSKKRIHRIGQDKPCFYYLLLCRGSIEEKILAALEKRQDYTEKLFEKDGE